MNPHDLYICARDAEAIAAMLAAHRRAHPFEADASDELAELLFTARLVPAGTLPADRVALRSRVTYEEEPHGSRRTVSLVLPEEADAGQGRISVLTPIGLALLGRRRGARSAAEMPNGRTLAVRIVDTVPAAEPLLDAA